jgi:predicted phosphoribosyltransferase
MLSAQGLPSLTIMFGSSSGGTRFADRRAAGQALGRALSAFAGPDVVVLALPRGGVPVGFEVATALGAPLDVLVVRKLGFPGHPEFAMGAIASGGVRVMNDEIPPGYLPTPTVIDEVIRAEQQELERRERAYRGHNDLVPVKGRTVLLVDDGLATGTTMRAAVRAVRQLAPSRIVVAVPVASTDACVALRSIADEVLCLRTPEPFNAVGLWYEVFDQTSDDEVARLLATPTSRLGGPQGGRA